MAPDLQERFPAECLARVTVVLRDGRRWTSPTLGARGDPDDPLSDDELGRKFEHLVTQGVGAERCERIRQVVDTLEDRPVADLLDGMV